MPSFAAAPEGVAITSSAQGGSADKAIEWHERGLDLTHQYPNISRLDRIIPCNVSIVARPRSKSSNPAWRRQWSRPRPWSPPRAAVRPPGRTTGPRRAEFPG